MDYKDFKRVVRLDILNDTGGSNFNTLVEFLVDIKERGKYVERFDGNTNTHYIEYVYMGDSIFNNKSSAGKKYHKTSYKFRIVFDNKHFQVYGKNIKNNNGLNNQKDYNHYLMFRDSFIDNYIRDFLDFDKYLEHK